MYNFDPNSDEQRQSSGVLSDDGKDQCLQYLLNELQPDQVAAFEKQLANSEQLAEELQRQSEMIAMLSDASAGSPTVPDLKRPLEDRPAQKNLVKLACIALAVCITGLAFRTWWSSTEPQALRETSSETLVEAKSHHHLSNTTVSESILIARAWAAGQMEKDADILSEAALPGTEPQPIISLDDKFAAQDEETKEASNESFSWMFTAAYEIQEVETNDG